MAREREDSSVDPSVFSRLIGEADEGKVELAVLAKCFTSATGDVRDRVGDGVRGDPRSSVGVLLFN